MADGIARALETMHPMREPPLPASLAPFGVTLALGCAAGLVLLALALAARRRRTGLRMAALAALARTRALAGPERLAAQAALLRRLVRQIAGEDAARLQGAAWLEELDRVFAVRFFTQGAGAAYGEALYAAKVPDVDVLDGELEALFSRLRSPSPFAGEGGAKRRMRGSARLSSGHPATGQNPSSDPASRGHLLPQGEKVG